MDFIRTFLIGTVIGIANVIPGVSGGTMAVVFNIYDRFVDAITLNVKKLIANWKFVVPMLLGMATGILFFSNMITILYGKFPNQTNHVFTGIILGSIPMLYVYTIRGSKTKNGQNRKVPSISTIISVVAGLAFMLAFAYFQNKYGSTKAGIAGSLPSLTVPFALRLLFGGILGAVAMIIPGISGSFIMLILGIYPFIIAGVAAIVKPSTFVPALCVLLPNGIGILIGLLCGAKAISWLIKNFPNQTYGVILGMIFGSVILVFPGFSTWNSVLNVIISLVCVAAGFALAFFSSKNELKTK